MIDSRAAFDAVNQKAAAILRKITAYDVPLIPLKNDTSSYPIYWFKKKGEKWLYYNRERGELDTSIWAENDDEMVYSTVFRSLSNYALQHFVMWRERNGKDPYRKYDDFMEECLHIVYANGNSIVTLNMMTENTQSLTQTITKVLLFYDNHCVAHPVSRRNVPTALCESHHAHPKRPTSSS
jgi:hypothetical protein